MFILFRVNVEGVSSLRLHGTYGIYMRVSLFGLFARRISPVKLTATIFLSRLTHWLHFALHRWSWLFGSCHRFDHRPLHSYDRRYRTQGSSSAADIHFPGSKNCLINCSHHIFSEIDLRFGYHQLRVQNFDLPNITFWSVIFFRVSSCHLCWLIQPPCSCIRRTGFSVHTWTTFIFLRLHLRSSYLSPCRDRARRACEDFISNFERAPAVC
jgi:hypothetical protein